MQPLDTSFKLEVYNALVTEVKASQEVCKQAIAFLIEAMSKLYPLDQSKSMLQGLVDRVKKEPNGASAFLDQQIATAYEGFLVLDMPKDGKNRDALIGIYNSLKEARDAARAKGSDAHFGGIPTAYVPSWYPKN